MNKAIKFKNNTYMDSSGIVHDTNPISNLINNLIYGKNNVAYHPSHLASMTSENYDTSIDISKTYIFYTDWLNYSSYDHRFSGVMGVYIKGTGSNSTGGVAIIFYYSGSIGINIRIDGNRWGGWKWL